MPKRWLADRLHIFAARGCETTLHAMGKCFAKKMPLFKCSAKTHRARAMHSQQIDRAVPAPMSAVAAGRSGSAPEKNLHRIVDMPKNRD
jgi:hypothetical protein